MDITVLILRMGWWFGKRRGIEKKRKKIKSLMQVPFMLYSCENVFVCLFMHRSWAIACSGTTLHVGQCKALQVQNA